MEALPGAYEGESRESGGSLEILPLVVMPTTMMMMIMIKKPISANGEPDIGFPVIYSPPPFVGGQITA